MSYRATCDPRRLRRVRAAVEAFVRNSPAPCTSGAIKAALVVGAADVEAALASLQAGGAIEEASKKASVTLWRAAR